MRAKLYSLIILVVLLAMPFAASGGNDKEKEQLKQAIDELKSEIVQLQRQVGSLKEGMDRNSGQMSALITQISDNVSAMRQAQSRVSSSSESAIGAVSGIREEIGTTRDKIDRVSSQVAALKLLIENMPKLPAFDHITPGDPDALFGAAVADHSRGNYDLAISEFKQFVETFPTSEMAGRAQYWLAKCHFEKSRFNEALTEYYNLIRLYPKCDRTCLGRFEMGKTLQKLGRHDEADGVFKEMVVKYKGCYETAQAQQEIGQR
jgi:TolA-binding protein